MANTCPVTIIKSQKINGGSLNPARKNFNDIDGADVKTELAKCIEELKNGSIAHFSVLRLYE